MIPWSCCMTANSLTTSWRWPRYIWRVAIEIIQTPHVQGDNQKSIEDYIFVSPAPAELAAKWELNLHKWLIGSETMTPLKTTISFKTCQCFQVISPVQTDGGDREGTRRWLAGGCWLLRRGGSENMFSFGWFSFFLFLQLAKDLVILASHKVTKC